MMISSVFVFSFVCFSFFLISMFALVVFYFDDINMQCNNLWLLALALVHVILFDSVELVNGLLSEIK